ncbi:MAG: hypothetical protein ACRD0X_08175, partial [Thermoanaerobaculia bacterium]
MSEAPNLRALRPWYHDFSALGLTTDFERGLAGRWRRLVDACRGRGGLLTALRPGSPPHRRNQRAKEAVLRPLLASALADLPATPRCLDLFCADGYTTCTIGALAPGAHVLGVDREPD